MMRRKAIAMSFKSFFSPAPPPDAGDSDSDGAGLTQPRKMNLEERMAYRREMLFEAIGLAMDRQGIAESCYRLRVSRTDKRGHAYAVMISLSNDFLHDARGNPASLQEIGRTIAAVAGASGLLEVNGVYWSVLDQPGGLGGRRTETPASEAAVTRPPLKRVEIAIDQRIYASDIAPLEH
jgi:hypothetical protein